jgi:hypothetical protein
VLDWRKNKMIEEELKKEIEKRKKAVRDRGVMEDDLREYEDYEYSPESWWDGEIMILERELIAFQKGKLEQKKEGLIIMNGSNVDLRICETEAISEDEDEINQIGVIKSGCGLRVYPKYNSIYIEQLQKEIGEEKGK